MNNQRRAVVLAVFGLVLMTAVACGGSSSTPTPAGGATEPTATATPITSDTFEPTPTPIPTRPPAVEPYPTRTPLPPTPEPMQVVWLTDDQVPEPLPGTVYEDLLAALPDNGSTRKFASLSDHAGVMEFLGIELPEPGASEDVALHLFEQITAAVDSTGFAPEFPVWPQASRDYLSIINGRSQYVGFEHWQVAQTAHAGESPGFYDFAFGEFDPQRTADSLAGCDCDQPDTREHAGVEYYAWGPEFIGELEKRNGPPLYDHVGRGPRLLIRPGQGFYSVSNEVMEGFIDVTEGTRPSLADDDGYIEAARALASLGLMRNMTFYASGLAADEVIDFASQNQALFQETVRTVDLLRPFDLVATGTGFDGESAFTGMVISNPDEVTAELNAERLIDRIWNIPVSTRTSTTLSEQMERVEIVQDGALVLARFYFRDVTRTLFGFPILRANTLVLHE